MNRPLVMLAITLAALAVGFAIGFAIGGFVFSIASPRTKIVSQLTGELGGVGTYRLSVPPHRVGLTIQNPSTAMEQRGAPR